MRKAPTTVIRQTMSSTMIITSFMWTLPMAPDPFFTGCSTAALAVVPATTGVMMLPKLALVTRA